MRKIGLWQFPEQGNRAECDAWEPFTSVVPLSKNVLTVAETRIEGAWSAYCDAVPGERHNTEHVEVLRSGTKLPERVARAIFREFDEVPYAP